MPVIHNIGGKVASRAYVTLCTEVHQRLRLINLTTHDDAQQRRMTMHGDVCAVKSYTVIHKSTQYDACMKVKRLKNMSNGSHF